MRHEIEFYSQTNGKANLVLISFGLEAPAAAYIGFQKKGFSRLDAMLNGSQFLKWFEDMQAGEEPLLPGDWVLIASSLEFDDVA